MLTSVDEDDVFSTFNGTIDNLEVGNDAAIRIEDGVENECLQRCIGIAFWRGNALNDSAENVVDTLTCFAGGANDVFAFATNEFDDFIFHFLRHGVGHVAFVEHGNDFQIVLDGHIEVGNGLCLNALRGVYHEETTFAGCDGATHLISEVHVSRSVNEIEHVVLTIHFVVHLDGVTFDRDTTFLFEVHVVEHLTFGDFYGRRAFQQSVG